MKSTTKLWSVALVLWAALATAGCVSISALSSHTLQVGPDRQTDVVWIVDRGRTVYRCTNEAGGPVCTRVRVP
jgi:hypothetical protein